MAKKYQITSPDGRKFEIEAPDDATQEQVMAYAQQQFSQQVPQPAQQPAQQQPASTSSFPPGSRGAMLTAQREAAGGGLRGLGQAFARDIRELPRNALEAAKPLVRDAGITARGLGAGLGGVVGTFVDPVTQGINFAAGTNIPTFSEGMHQAADIVGLPRPQGGMEKAGEFLSEMIGGAVGGRAMTPAIEGLSGIPATTRATQEAMRQGANLAPTSQQLRAGAQRAYAQAESAGVRVRADRFRSVVDDIAETVRKSGINNRIHPDASAALDDLLAKAKSGADISFEDLEILRRVVLSAEDSAKDSEVRIAAQMIGKIDDFIAKLSPDDVTSGNSSLASSAIREARSLWSRSQKAEDLSRLVRRAELRATNFTRSGFENALRNEFRTMALSDTRMRGFTTAERRAIERVVKGGRIENLFRFFGKLAPTGVVSAGLSGGAGFVMGGPAGAVALPAFGGLSRGLATGATSRNARLAEELVRRGGPAISGMAPQANSIMFGASTALTPDEETRRRIVALLQGQQ